MQLVNLQMNELEEVEGTNKKISKQQGLQSSNSKQQGQASELTWQHATGKGSLIYAHAVTHAVVTQ